MLFPTEQNPQECLKIKDEILFPLCSMKIAVSIVGIENEAARYVEL